MFDTILIKPLINAIDSKASLTIQEPSFDFKTKEKGQELILWQDSKKVISGAKCFCNTEHFNFTIKRNLNPYARENTVATLQFSLPKQKNKSNVETVCEETFNESLEQLYKNIYSAGLDIDIENSPVVRFDCAKNVNTLINSKQFVNVFQSYDVPRMKKQVHDSSLLYYNANTELNIYDKPREQGTISRNSFSSVCRFEMRNKTSKVCRNGFNVFTFADLKRNYKDIKNKYTEYVDNKFFSGLSLKSAVFGYNFSDVFDYFKTNSKRNFLQNAINYFAFLYLQDNNLSADFVSLCKQFDVSRNNISKIQRRFNSFSVLKKQFDSLKNKKNYFEYVHDLRKNFLKAS